MTTTEQTTIQAPETGPFVCPDDHGHDKTWTCYKTHKCRCAKCRTRNASKVADWRTRTVTGHVDSWVRDVATVREHVMFLRSLGMTVGQIADRAGVGVKTIGFICNGRSRQVAPVVFDSLMGVKFAMKPAAEYDTVDATGTRRRLQALTRHGWPGADLMARLGKDAGYSTHMLTARTVQKRTADEVAALYDELWAHTPPDTTASRRARLRAERHGWHPALAWDDETIDDPSAEPSTTGFADAPDVIRAALDGERPELTPAQRREVITILNERRWAAHQIGEHIGCAADTVHRIRRELGLPIYLANGTHYKDGTVAA